MKRQSYIIIIFVSVATAVGLGAFFIRAPLSQSGLPAASAVSKTDNFMQPDTSNTEPEKNKLDATEIVADTPEVSSQTPKLPVTNEESTQVSSELRVMAWLYPGDPACGAAAEYSDGRKIDILKPEYFMVGEDGGLLFLTEKHYGCNGYSSESVAELKKHASSVYATVSSSYAVSMDLFLQKALADNAVVETLVSFTVNNDLDGIEIDFEDFGGWTKEGYERYKQFIKLLGDSLHQHDKKLMIDGPAVSNQIEELWFVWRYEDFTQLPIDHLVVMAYDYQFDHGSGKPVAPLQWIEDVISWVTTKYNEKSKLTIGIPSYGYRGVQETQTIVLRTYEQMRNEPGFESAVRNTASHEMTWKNGDSVYFYQDSESMRKKRKVIERAGIDSISVWHLGGNQWFTP